MTFELNEAHRPRKLPDMLPRFELAITTRVITGKAMPMGSYGGTGQRMMVPIIGGDFAGPAGVHGRVVPGGIEWPLVRPDGVGTIDARYTFETHDGVFINVRNTGYRYGPPELMRRLNAGEGWIDPDEYYFRTWSVFEAPVGPYEWLSRFAFFGIAERVPECLFLNYFKLL